jgi:hypothetical protein
MVRLKWFLVLGVAWAVLGSAQPVSLPYFQDFELPPPPSLPTVLERYRAARLMENRG